MLTCDPTTRADSSDSRAFKYTRQESFTETHKYFLMFRIFINPKPEKSLCPVVECIRSLWLGVINSH